MTRPSPRRRRGVALEVVIASALLVAVALPLATLLQTNQKVAFLDEFQVLARRRALRALAVLEGQPYAALRARATGEAPPASGVAARISPDAREVAIPLPATLLEVTLENLPAKAREAYNLRVATVPVRAYFAEVEPGLGRLSVLVQWVDPSSQTGRGLVVEAFVVDPFPWRSMR